MVFAADVDVDVNSAHKGVCSEIVTAYENLASEIVVVACRDYRWMLRRIKKNGMDIDAEIEKESIERFFRSDWFRVLCRLDPEELIEKLQKEAAVG